MKINIRTLLYMWLELRKPDLRGMKCTIKNPLVILRKQGTIKLADGYEVSFDRSTKKDILKVVWSCLINGIHCGDGKYKWNFYPEKGIIKTHQGILFGADSVGLLDETFLFQIHFSGFDLKDKIVITAGAYKGDTPLFYSYYGARVYAFEPDPKSFKIPEKILL
jgi:hypothetical protein